MACQEEQIPNPGARARARAPTQSPQDSDLWPGSEEARGQLSMTFRITASLTRTGSARG